MLAHGAENQILLDALTTLFFVFLIKDTCKFFIESCRIAGMCACTKKNISHISTGLNRTFDKQAPWENVLLLHYPISKKCAV